MFLRRFVEADWHHHKMALRVIVSRLQDSYHGRLETGGKTSVLPRSEISNYAADLNRRFGTWSRVMTKYDRKMELEPIATGADVFNGTYSPLQVNHLLFLFINYTYPQQTIEALLSLELVPGQGSKRRPIWVIGTHQSTLSTCGAKGLRGQPPWAADLYIWGAGPVSNHPSWIPGPGDLQSRFGGRSVLTLFKDIFSAHVV